ncbi:MAG: PUR family DNA/RNA-binding protein [Bacteroidales bacterium]|nr:PUR family DNA/RNA-binding protein [Bacteroidales bacterium]
MEDMDRGKEEIYSKAIRAGKRTYFLDVKEMKSGDRYLAITESKRKFLDEQGKFVYEKHKIFLYQEDFEKFIKGLTQTVNFINTGELPPEEPEEQNFSRDSGNTYTAKVDDIDFGV